LSSAGAYIELVVAGIAFAGSSRLVKLASRLTYTM